MTDCTMFLRVMGTPNEETWPGVTALPDFKSAFPKWPSKVLKKINTLIYLHLNHFTFFFFFKFAYSPLNLKPDMYYKM